MRSLIVGLFILGLGLSPSQAGGPCSQALDYTKHLTEKSPVYEAVDILVVMPVQDNVEAESRKGIVHFAIHGRDANVRRHAETPVESVHQCSFASNTSRTDKILIRIRAHTIWEWNRDDSYTLRAGFILPKSLVARRPHVETELETGEVLRGSWDKVQVPLSPRIRHVKKGKKTIKVVTPRYITVTRLVLREE